MDVKYPQRDTKQCKTTTKRNKTTTQRHSKAPVYDNEVQNISSETKKSCQ